tara:strand:+ start:8102 stop:9259 length:1158 start_codon:yes stop_codon:yes gene_type:complete
MIPYSRQKISNLEIQSVIKVLKSDFLTQGPILPKFENKLKKKVNAKYAVAVNSATSALHIACMSLGIGKGDSVWTSSNTFVASVNCAIYCGADIDLIDIEYKSYNLDIVILENKLRIAKKNKNLPKAIIPVHFAGNPTRQRKIYTLSKKYGFKIIEDASHSLGAKQNEEPVGSCKYSDLTVFSFHPVKNITTAEGGAVVTNNKTLYEGLLMFRNHGITKNKNKFKKFKHFAWYFEQQEIGYNYRMNEIQAAIGIVQLKKLDSFIKKRNSIAKKYDSMLDNLPVKKIFIENSNYCAFHLYPIVIENFNLKKIDTLINFFKKNKIYLQKHYIPIYRHPYHSKNFNIKNFPKTEKYFRSSVSLPIFPDLKINHQKKIVTILKNFIEQN